MAQNRAGLRKIKTTAYEDTQFLYTLPKIRWWANFFEILQLVRDECCIQTLNHIITFKRYSVVEMIRNVRCHI